MSINFDIFYRTTASTHIRAVQTALTKLKEKGEIEFREYEGAYCVGCERFLKPNELNDNGLCPDHEKKPEYRKEENYFFLMSKYQDRLVKYFAQNENSIQPSQYRGEILSFLKEPLQDLCISRPKERLKWGVELPFDDKFVTYVWVDALTNYIAALGWPNGNSTYKKFDLELWSTATHLIGKDIIKTHAVYWGAILLALDLPLFKEIHVNGFLLMGDSKMSKSLGNVVKPLEIEEEFGRETLRFYLLREMSYGQDGQFTPESYLNCTNAYLANGIGNLVSRVVTLCHKNFGHSIIVKNQSDIDRSLLAKIPDTQAAWDEGFDQLKYQNSLKAWTELVTQCNTYINDEKPWDLAKHSGKDQAKKERLEAVLGTCLQVIGFLGVLVYPVLPEASEKLISAIGLAADRTKNNNAPSLKSGYTPQSEFKLQGEVPKLFQRVQIQLQNDTEK